MAPSQVRVFCRYLRCPHSTQGFRLSEVRDLHESSHLPTYRCDNAQCGLFGWTFTSKATMRKHVSAYHDEQHIPAILSLPSRKRRRVRGRALFHLEMMVIDVQAQLKDKEDSSDEDWLGNTNDIPPAFKQIEDDWSATYNPKIVDQTFRIKALNKIKTDSFGWALDLSQCDRFTAIGLNRRVVIYETFGGKLISTIDCFSDQAPDQDCEIYDLKFSPCSTYLATGDKHGNVKVRYPRDRQLSKILIKSIDVVFLHKCSQGNPEISL